MKKLAIPFGVLFAVGMAVLLIGGSSEIVTAQSCRANANCGTLVTNCGSSLVSCTQTCSDCFSGASLTIQVNNAGCVGGGNCPTTACGSGATLRADSTTTLSTGCGAGNREIEVCESWVDCNGATVCGPRCTYQVIDGLFGGTVTPGNYDCAPGASGTYQYQVTANDATGQSAPCAPNTCGACGSSCTSTSDCNQVAIAASCCIPL